MSSTDNAKQTVELTRHAQSLGADICYVLTPYFECSGKPGVLEFLRYVTDRTDGPIGLFNSHATGLVLTPAGVRGPVPRVPRAVRAEERAAGRRAQPRRP